MLLGLRAQSTYSRSREHTRHTCWAEAAEYDGAATAAEAWATPGLEKLPSSVVRRRLPNALLANRASALKRGRPMCDASCAKEGRPAKGEAALLNPERELPICWCCAGAAADSVLVRCREADASYRRLYVLRAQKRCARPAVTAVEVWRGRLPRSWLAKVPVAMDTF